MGQLTLPTGRGLNSTRLSGYEPFEADPFSGIGKPERLRHHKNPALYSRRIDQQHRLVYSVSDNTVTVVACRFHYDDK